MKKKRKEIRKNKKENKKKRKEESNGGFVANKGRIDLSKSSNIRYINWCCLHQFTSIGDYYISGYLLTSEVYTFISVLSLCFVFLSSFFISVKSFFLKYKLLVEISCLGFAR